ncbi:hypothetical protein PENTCL1PPCAC_20040, partial [Pristionchus entomophagus]
GEWTRKTQQHLQYIRRIMLMVMRSRGRLDRILIYYYEIFFLFRLGEAVSLLDIVCSAAALQTILDEMESYGVGWPTISNATKALISLMKFAGREVHRYQIKSQIISLNSGAFSSLGIRQLISDNRLILSTSLCRYKERQQTAKNEEAASIQA